MLLFLGAFLTAIKPLWIWGVVASSIGGLTSSGFVLRSINKYDPDFKEYYENRNPLRNIWHFIKSTAKLFIPIFNVFYGFYLLGKLFNRGASGLRDEWKARIYRADNRLKNIKSMGNSTKRIFKGLINKIKNRRSNTQTVTNTQTVNQNKVAQTQNRTQAAQPVVRSTQPVARTQAAQPVVRSTQPATSKFQQATRTQAAQPVVRSTQPATSKFQQAARTQATQPVASTQSSLSHLSAYLDSLNRSNMDTNTLLDYYNKEYWNLRRLYDDKVRRGLNAQDEYDKFVLYYNKCMELKQKRGLLDKPASLR